MNAVQFGELPFSARGSSGSRLDPAAAELRSRPGEWGKVETSTTRSRAGGTASAIKAGLLKAFRPPGSFESVSRDCDVWARYVGETGDPS